MIVVVVVVVIKVFMIGVVAFVVVWYMEHKMSFLGCVFPTPLSLFSTTNHKNAVEVFFRTSRPAQVCKLWLGVSENMLPVKHLDPRIPIAVDYCGRQLDLNLGWVAPVNHNKGANPHPGAHALLPV